MRINPSAIAGEFWYRGAVGILGALIGALLGLILAGPLVYLEVVNNSLARTIGAGAIAGALVGAGVPAFVLYGTQAALWFLAGLVGVMGDVKIGDPPERPRWLLVAFSFGAIYFFALAML